MWVLSVLDLYDATGDKDTLLSLQPWIEKRLNFGLVVAAPTGSLRWSRDDERMGFGFQSPDRPEAFRAFLALLAGASRRYATVIGALGNTTAATVYHSLAQNVTSRIRNGTDWFSKWGMHASADAINAGLVTPIEAAAMLGNMGVFGDPLQLPSLSIFESFFVLRAFGKVNATLQAMYLIKRHYGGMLALGATTTWERFDPQWTDAGCLAPESPPVNAMNSDTSMAHPWAAGATAWLTTYGLGVRATAPGFVRWVALPTIVDLDQLTSVRGTVPTPNGVIRFDLNITRGTLRVDVPAGTVAERIGLPMLGAGFRLVTTAGSTLFSNDSTALKSATNVEHDDRYLYVLGLTPGNHELAFEMHQPTLSVGPMLAGPWNPSNTSFLFPATYHGTDKVTSGVWRGKYGARGYKLFAMGPNGTDIERLPSFIHGVYAASIDPPQGGPPYPKPDTVSCKSAKGRVYACWQWGTTTNDPRVLENPEPSERRVLGGVTSKGWASFHLDVDVEESSPRFNITLFMLDADNLSIRQALKVRDGRTLHTISPMILVEDFSAVGAYVTIEYNGPMRIRFNEVPSPKGNKLGFPPRPVLSGVFFD
jgi:alpha-L-rhamnosidase